MPDAIVISTYDYSGFNVLFSIEATRGLSVGRQVVDAKDLRLIGLFSPDDFTPINITSLWTDKFGALTRGTVIFFKITPIGFFTGLATTPLISRILVT
jgi:hypothetical protein